MSETIKHKNWQRGLRWKIGLEALTQTITRWNCQNKGNLEKVARGDLTGYTLLHDSGTTIRMGGPRIKPSEEPKQREGKRFMMMMIWGLWWWWWWWNEGDKKKNRAMLLTSWTAALFCSLPQVEIKFNAMFSKFENLELSDWVWIYWSIYASEKRKNSQNQQQILWNYDQVGE